MSHEVQWTDKYVYYVKTNLPLRLYMDAQATVKAMLEEILV